MTYRILASAGICVLACLSPALSSAPAERVAVADELERLSKEYGFEVRGLEQTEDAFGSSGGDQLYPRLRRLLEDFDHVIVQGPGGGIDRVIVLGEKVPFEPLPPAPRSAPTDADETAAAELVLETTRLGTQHAVRVSLEGEGGKRVENQLLVDTGADYVVLPRSLAAKLGLDTRDLEEREMQTANGKVTAVYGTLPGLWLGQVPVRGVAAAFIDDQKLGESGLLGMSVLGRYKVTIDDENSRITLSSKRAGAPAKEAEDGAEDPDGKTR